MRKQDYLVQFIAGMSTAEKRFFREYIKRSNRSVSHLKLFQTIEKAKTYDTAEFTRTLGIDKTKLAHEKERLQELVLRSTRQWMEISAGDATYELWARAQEVNLLANRNLCNYAYSLGKKAAENALQQERYLLSNIILNTNAECLAIMGDYTQSIAQKEAVIRNNGIIMENDELSLLQLKVIKAISRGRIAPGQFKDLPRHALMKRPTGHLQSYNAKMTQLALWCYYYEDIKSDRAKLLHYVKQIYDLCLASRDTGYFNATHLAIAMCHLIAVLSVGGNYNEAMQKLQELEEWLARHKKGWDMLKYERYAEVQRLVLYNELQQFDRTSEAAAKVIKGRKEEFLGYNEATLFYYAVSLFHTGKTDSCLKVLQKLLSVESRTRLELLLPTRVLFILAQYETGNLRLLSHLIKALNAFLKRSKINLSQGGSLPALLNKLAKSEYRELTANEWQTFYKMIKGEEFNGSVREIFLSQWLKRKCGLRA